ncbi:hypothetical protein JAAARDRAFT_31941 [Jaapia argillacea MUCL 33604]|uniref:Transcription factor spt8 beta-propeller domain-containing protein n=1 Tax=Jaapia argillacea MUCL 33604 TaxID=933084 RepID=A0A067Q1M9_9AGAM|nr:hypothetical protein JAAARDRAFT_31941 [Jaapia argillacea MUCL 33604]
MTNGGKLLCLLKSPINPARLQGLHPVILTFTPKRLRRYRYFSILLILEPSQDVLSPPCSRTRSPSPAHLRRSKVLHDFGMASLRSYTVEAICAIPHPTPTHALAASFCMTHVITGSEDGYVRDYDIFAAVNGKNFLTAPQRHHCGVIEGTMKAGQIRLWWENPADANRLGAPPIQETQLSPIYSLSMQSDALWALAGSSQGHINLFTVRHDPGRLCHVMRGHRGHVSALSLQHDEKGFFSAGWDGEAMHWDLNTGQIVRKFTSHGAQLAVIAVRPLSTSSSDGFHPNVDVEFSRPFSNIYDPEDSVAAMDAELTQVLTQELLEPTSGDITNSTLLGNTNEPLVRNLPRRESDAKSDASFDPLFDDEPDGDAEMDDSLFPRTPLTPGLSMPGADVPQIPGTGGVPPGIPNAPSQPQVARPNIRTSFSQAAVPKNAPPLLDPASYATFSPDLLMIASVDGQVMLWDRRVQTPGTGVGRLWMSEKTPPWCVSACWSANGNQIYAGRRNGTIDIWDVRQMGRSGPSGTPRLMKTLRNPLSSGVVSCVVAFPDSRHLACASIDNIRLWNVAEAGEPDASGRTKSGAQFKIIPGHHGGFVSQMLVDPAARFLISASSNRGWHGDSTRTVFVHEIKHLT